MIFRACLDTIRARTGKTPENFHGVPMSRARAHSMLCLKYKEARMSTQAVYMGPQFSSRVKY